jgi:hypothetical protein
MEDQNIHYGAHGAPYARHDPLRKTLIFIMVSMTHPAPVLSNVIVQDAHTPPCEAVHFAVHNNFMLHGI